PKAALAAGLACALLMNGKDLYLRGETMPESFAKSFLQNLDPDATLVVNTDDAVGACRYLQTVRGFRPDVRIVILSYLQPGPGGKWYLEAVRRRWPDFAMPNFESVGEHAATYTNLALAQ